MLNNQITESCDICGSSLPFGQHRYALRHNHTYDLWVCDMCRAGNSDGWARHLELQVTRRLLEQEKSLPQRTKDGLLPYE